jgi:hypothetical protein
MSSKYGGKSGSGSPIRPLYGVWIDQALSSNDPAQMKELILEARKIFDERPHVLYGVVIDQAIQSNASREELQQLLSDAKATLSGDLQGAVKRLEAHLGGSSGGGGSMGKK